MAYEYGCANKMATLIYLFDGWLQDVIILTYDNMLNGC